MRSVFNINSFRWKEIFQTIALQISISFCFIAKLHRTVAHPEMFGCFWLADFNGDPAKSSRYVCPNEKEKHNTMISSSRWWGGDKRDKRRNEKLIEPKAVTRLRVNWIFRFHDSSSSFLLLHFLFFPFFPSLALFFFFRLEDGERAKGLQTGFKWPLNLFQVTIPSPLGLFVSSVSTGLC